MLHFTTGFLWNYCGLKLTQNISQANFSKTYHFFSCVHNISFFCLYSLNNTELQSKNHYFLCFWYTLKAIKVESPFRRRVVFAIVHQCKYKCAMTKTWVNVNRSWNKNNTTMCTMYTIIMCWPFKTVSENILFFTWTWKIADIFIFNLIFFVFLSSYFVLNSIFLFLI